MAYLKDEFQNLEQEYRKKNTFLRRWSAVIILLLFFLFSWAGQYVAQLQNQKQIAEDHGKEFQMSEFWPEFWASTLENWQSEWLQLTAQAVLVVGYAEYMFRKGNEEVYKTHLLLEDLRNELVKGRK